LVQELADLIQFLLSCFLRAESVKGQFVSGSAECPIDKIVDKAALGVALHDICSIYMSPILLISGYEPFLSHDLHEFEYGRVSSPALCLNLLMHIAY
jgi:hypothetical protein